MIPLSLFSLNVGIELGQLAFVGAVLATGRLVRPVLAGLPSPKRWLAPYAVGSLGAFWLFDRMLGG